MYFYKSKSLSTTVELILILGAKLSPLYKVYKGNFPLCAQITES